MQQNQNRGRLNKRALLLVVGVVLGIGFSGALAQIIPSTGNGTNIGTLLQQFGSLFGDGTGTTTQPGTGTGGGTGTTTQPGGSGGRAPVPVSNQFNTTHTSSLQERRPGVWVQNGIAEANGTSTFLMGNATDEPPNFYKATFDQIALNIIDMITNAVSGLNALFAANNGLPPPTATTLPSDGLTTIDNATTTGAGTSVPIQ